jgi:hypothetical protein
MMNPYCSVFFAPAIEDPLRTVGTIYNEAGYKTASIERFSSHDLGLAVAEAMLEFTPCIGFPTRLSVVVGFSNEHIGIVTLTWPFAQGRTHRV